jgi:hypothetical protein
MTAERVRFPASGANPPMLEGELWLPDPERMRLVPGIDHMWRGFEPILADAARGFFAEALAASASR